MPLSASSCRAVESMGLPAGAHNPALLNETRRDFECRRNRYSAVGLRQTLPMQTISIRSNTATSYSESQIGVDPGMLEMAVMASCHDQENPRSASFVALF